MVRLYVQSAGAIDRAKRELEAAIGLSDTFMGVKDARAALAEINGRSPK